MPRIHSEMNGVAVLYFVMTAGGGVALFINIFLLFIIILSPSRDLGTYKYLILSYTSVATALSSIHCSAVPMFTGGKGGILFYSTLPRLSIELGNFLLTIYSNCYAQIALILTLSFCYRYKVMHRTRNFEWIFKWKFKYFLLFCVLLIGLVYGIPASYCVASDYLNQLNNQTIFDITGYYSTELSIIGGIPFIEGRPTMMAYTAILYVMGVLFAIGIIVGCVVRLNRYFLKHNPENLSNKTRKLQKQFYTLLILQTLSPVVFTFTPLLICFPLGFFKIEIPTQIHLIYSCLLPFAQICEPLLVFGFIKDYRLFYRKVCCPPEGTVAPNVVSYTDPTISQNKE